LGGQTESVFINCFDNILVKTIYRNTFSLLVD